MKVQVTYQGQWQFPGKILRVFNLHLPDGRIPSFSVAPSEDLKNKMAECLLRFSKTKAAA